MYLDLVVVLIVIIIGLVKYKKFSSYVYLFCFSDICFMVLNTINDLVSINGMHEFIDSYIPSSIYSVIVKYTTDIVQTVLIWAYLIVFIIFLYYTLQSLLKRK